MASKASPGTAAGRVQPRKNGKVIVLKLSAKLLRQFEPVFKTESAASKSSSTTSDTLPAALSPADNASESQSNTPAPNGTPAPTSMLPPTEGIKKKGIKAGTKRSSGVALEGDGTPKPKGKPGPKKKPRLEDGSIDPNATPKGDTKGAGAGHKLGPKANQGAINAGLRALDRSGAPCRKWQKGGFSIKSFTGAVWQIPRWKAPSRPSTAGSSDASMSNSEGSKENKESIHIRSENGVSAGDGEQISMVSSPAPPVIVAS